MNNYHTHTYRCHHAFGTEEDYIQKAIEQQMEELGFSDHAPFPHHDYGLRMAYEELDDYLLTLDRLREQYQNRIRLLKGLEIEYYADCDSYYQRLLTEKGLDYLLLGAHSFVNAEGTFKNIFFAESTNDFLDYADNVCAAMQTGFFRCVAHPDLFFINDFPIDKHTEEACRRIIEEAKKQDMILEFNANGYRRIRQNYADGLRYPYPHRYFWKLAKQAGIRVIIGSDCHVPVHVCDHYVLTARQNALQWGLNVIDTLF